MPEVLVAVARIGRWIDNFATRHGGVSLTVVDGALCGSAPDGSTFVAHLPFSRAYAGAPDAAALAAAAAPPPEWGVLLVRKGGFAVARLRGTELTASKVGKRHVQGRTKAGGWSQQRFARRRDNQARVALEAAGEHAARILEGLEGPLVYGGIEEAAPPDALRLPGHVADPRRDVLDRAIADAQSLRIEVSNAPEPAS